MQFFIEVMVGGLLAGVMYSLVALGFVLIYKASGVFNFAQGALVLFAALTFVSIEKMGVPFWIVFVLASVIFLLRSSKKAMSFSRPFWKFSLPIIILSLIVELIPINVLFLTTTLPAITTCEVIKQLSSIIE